MRVAIAGGGIAGLAAAVALRRRGIEAVVYERAPALREVGAGIALWPNATRALRHLGVLDAVAERSGPADRVCILDPEGRTLLRFSTARPDAPALCVRRRDLVRALAAALPADAVCYGSQVASIRHTPRGVEMSTADGRDVQADLVVVADGIRSRLRERLGLANAPVYQGYTAWRAVGPRPADLEGDAFEAWGGGLRFGLFSLDAGRAYWYGLASRPESATVEDDHAELEALFAGWHPRVTETISATDAIVRHDVYDLPRSRRWVAGRAVLVGDAAHGMTPDLGQGGAFALEDAVALADRLGEGDDIDASLAGYVRERARRAASVGRRSRWSGRLGQLDGWRGRLRNRVALATPSRLFEAAFTAPF